MCLGIEGCDFSFVGILVEDLLSSLWYSGCDFSFVGIFLGIHLGGVTIGKKEHLFVDSNSRRIKDI
jgi:hypothetical protein